MPRLAPQMGPTMEEVTGEVDDALKAAKKVLDAAATAKLLEGVKTVATGDGSSSAKEMGEVVSAVASSMKSAGELQSSLIKQMAELVQRENGLDDAELKSMMNRVMMIKMFEALGGQSRQGVPPELKEVLDLLREENRRLREEIEKLKEERRPDPVSEQMQSLTMQLLNQHISNVANPFQGLRELAKMREELRDLIGPQESVPPEYSEGALRAKALEKEIRALEMEENIRLKELEQKERMVREYVPGILNQAGAVLANVLQSFGLAPVRPLQFDGEAAAEAERMAEGA